MPKADIVGTYRSIKDHDKWSKYAKLAVPAIQQAGGRFIVRGMPAKTYEKGLKERVVVVEFDSLEQASAAHDTPAYREALRALGDGAERDIRVVEGVG